jgi:MFS family permease
VGFLFAVSSLIFGTWVAAIPIAKQKFGFTDGSLGLSLLLSPLGAITAMLLSRRIFQKMPVGNWLFYGYCLLCLIMPIQMHVNNIWIFWACLYFYGFVSFLNGVSSNATVSTLEFTYKRLFMSTCHGMYSLGGAVSAGLAAFFFYIGIESGGQILIVGGTIIGILLLLKSNLMAHREIIHSKSDLRLPSLAVLGISFICMVTFMAEGCVADWSAIYFKEVLIAPKEWISGGYAVFSIAMTIGRLNGDSLISKIGSKTVVVTGSALAAGGFLLVAFAGIWWLALIGYLAVGIGCSCIVPVLFSASANIPNLSKVEGFAMVTTGGLIGFLAGPSLIGFISEKFDLSKGFLLLTLLGIIAVWIAAQNHFLVKKTVI